LALVIIGGSRKGLKLALPPAAARPTAAAVREAVFSMIADAVPGSRALDLFAGSGAMGLEALSRGAARAVLCDRDPEVLKVLKKNAARFGPEPAAAVLALDFPAGYPALAAQGPFDLLLLDPPYSGADLAPGFMRAAPGLGLCSPEALLVWEMGAAALKTLESADTGAFGLVKSRSWGAKAAAILRFRG
jgi:16S rRNA (guanine966-N2)-methyltransferase